MQNKCEMLCKCFANVPQTWDYANALTVSAPTTYLDGLLVALKCAKTVQSLISVQFDLTKPGFTIISLTTELTMYA